MCLCDKVTNVIYSPNFLIHGVQINVDLLHNHNPHLCFLLGIKYIRFVVLLLTR